MKRTVMLVLMLWPAAVRPADSPNIELMLEASLPPIVGQVPEAAPPRFVLLADGHVFLGGTSDILEGRLTGSTLKELRNEVNRLRKLKTLRDRVELGPGDARYQLRLGKGREIVATGNLATAPYDARLLAAFIQRLLRFDDPSLKLYHPEQYELTVRNGSLEGGCRTWTLPVPIVDALATPRTIPAAAVASWPTGARAASVCANDKTFIVTLKPLLPWERR